MIRKIQRNLRKARGFTLVELMIVVAIIGILASLAIYGVRKYTTNAKTGEVKTALGRIGKDAASAFQREKLTSAAVLADNGVAGISNTLCEGAKATVPAAVASVKGQKYQSAATEWADETATKGWPCLKFSMSEPQYYMYDYNTTAATATTFTADGTGDLDGDGTAFSTFQLAGAVRDGQVVLAPTIAETNVDE